MRIEKNELGTLIKVEGRLYFSPQKIFSKEELISSSEEDIMNLGFIQVHNILDIMFIAGEDY